MNKSMNEWANFIVKALLNIFHPGEAIMVLSQARQLVKAEINK